MSILNKETTGEFVVSVEGELKTYHNYSDIPDKIDNVKKYSPAFYKAYP